MINRVISIIAIANLFIGPVVARSHSQQEKAKTDKQEQIVKLKTDLFEVRAVVTDKKGKLIDNLNQEDFELLENGRPQHIEFFSKERLPQKTAAESKSVGPTTVESNPARAPEAGRTVALFIDNIHLSHESQLRIRQTLRQFIQEKLTDRDLAAVIVSGGQMGLFNQFTRDRRMLLYAVDKLSIGSQAVSSSKFTPYIASAIVRGDQQAVDVGIEIVRNEEMLDLPPRIAQQYVETKSRSILAEAAYWRKVMLGTLKETIKRMADYPGQRMIAFVSDGFSLSDSFLQDTGDLNKAISRANASGVVIYSISAKGLLPPVMFDASSRFPISPGLSSYLSGSEKDLRDGMNALAKDTGGDAFFNSNDLKGMFKRVLDDNEIYYSMAYYPPDVDESRDKYRKIAVRVKNHPEYEVRAQKSFLASDLRPEIEKVEKSPQRRLVDAMIGALPTTTIGVSVAADFLESDFDSNQTTVQVHIDATTISFQEKNGQYPINLDVAVFFLDSSGKLAKEVTNNVRANLLPARMEEAKRSGFRYMTRTQLKPGIYQVRVGVREIGTERLGTGMALLEIPDLKKNKLALSGLFISEAKAEDEKQDGKESKWEFYNARVNRGLPVFKVNSNLVCSLMAYNVKQSEAGEETIMQVALIHDGNVVYQGEWKPLKVNLLAESKKGMLLGSQIKMAIEPGLYEIQVTIKEAKSKNSIQRSALFEVVA